MLQRSYVCVESDQTDSLEAFLASRLIPLDKNPGLQPIGVHEVNRRIICKVVVHTLKEDIIRSVASNAFNAVNHKLFLHNISMICPEIAVFGIDILVMWHRIKPCCVYISFF